MMLTGARRTRSSCRARAEPVIRRTRPERAAAVKKPRGVLGAYKSFFTQPQAALVLSFMFLYRLGDIMMFAMSKPLLRDIGIDTGQRGIAERLRHVAFIVGSLVGGGDHGALRADALPGAR